MFMFNFLCDMKDTLLRALVFDPQSHDTPEGLLPSLSPHPRPIQVIVIADHPSYLSSHLHLHHDHPSRPHPNVAQQHHCTTPSSSTSALTPTHFHHFTTHNHPLQLTQSPTSAFLCVHDVTPTARLPHSPRVTRRSQSRTTTPTSYHLYTAGLETPTTIVVVSLVP